MENAKQKSVELKRNLVLLECLDFKFTANTVEANSQDEPPRSQNERMVHNIHILKQNFAGQELGDLIECINQKLQCEIPIGSNINSSEPNIEYGLRLMLLMLNIIDNWNHDSDAVEDLISVRSISVFIKALQDMSDCAQCHLHETIYMRGILQKPPHYQGANNYSYLQLMVEFFNKALYIKQIHVVNSMKFVLFNYMAAIYTLQLVHHLQEHNLRYSDAQIVMRGKLMKLWKNLNKTTFMTCLMMMRANTKLPVFIKMKLNIELANKVASSGGFEALVISLVEAYKIKRAQLGTEPNNADYQSIYGIVASIASDPLHSLPFHTKMVTQIWLYFKHSVQLAQSAPNLEPYIGAALLSLQSLYKLRASCKEQIEAAIYELLQSLIMPKDMLAGLIVMSGEELSFLVDCLFTLFGRNSEHIVGLPTSLLVKYLPLLAHLYALLPGANLLRLRLSDIVVRCLHNRNRKELKQLLEHWYKHEFDENFMDLHARICVVQEMPTDALLVKISAVEANANDKDAVKWQLYNTLPHMLISESFHLVTFSVFMDLLTMLRDIWARDSLAEHDVSLLQSGPELAQFLQSKFELRCNVLMSLHVLIESRALRTQLEENADEFIKLLGSYLELFMRKPASSETSILLLLLVVTQELLPRVSQTKTYPEFLTTLRRLLDKPLEQHQVLRQHAQKIIAVLDGEAAAEDANNDAADFQEARDYVEMEEAPPHLLVFGMERLITLLQHGDRATMANTHVILALAIERLEHQDSFVYLNTIRLIVTLVKVNAENQVMEELIGQYLNEARPITYRLVVGEAILKVSALLGPMIYNHKNELANCFLRGACDNDGEFRASSLSNLSQLCRTLCYQVHSFFRELIEIVENELSIGTCLPAQRAAVMVLTELLDGIDDIMACGDLLQPVYRLLKTTLALNPDPVVKQHARKGLDLLYEKFNDLFQQTAQVPKHFEMRLPERNV